MIVERVKQANIDIALSVFDILKLCFGTMANKIILSNVESSES